MIIGNKEQRDFLKKVVKQDKIVNSYIFCGKEGIGKFLIAKEFAKHMLCFNKSLNCKCKSCIYFDSKTHKDFEVIEPDGNTIKIEQIRNLQENISNMPQISNRKVVIINDANKMTIEAQNALLKTLEEPPKYLTIILIVSNINNMLETIISRCINLNFSDLLPEEIEEYYKKHKDEIRKVLDNPIKQLDIKIDFNMLNGTILNLYNYIKNYQIYQNFDIILKNTNKITTSKFLELLNSLYEKKDEIYNILDYLEQMILKEANLHSSAIFVIEDVKKRLDINANYDMAIDKLLFDLRRVLIG